MPDPDIVSYNSMISGYSSNGLCDQALCLFICIQEKGLKPNHYTVTIMLGVCRTLVAIAEGKQLHAYIVKLQFLSEIAVSNALLTMYSKLGMMEEAEALFNKLPNRNFISWTAMISGLYQNGFYQQALRQFCYMCQHNERPNEYTYTIVFACCSSMKYVHNGRACHAQVIKNGLIAGVHVATSIVVLYSNFTEMDDAVKLFADIKTVASTVSWNALLMGFVSNEQNQDAVKFFKRMVEESVPCDEFTYSIILKACSCMPSLTSGEQIHSNLVKTGQKLTAQVGSSLIELYSRCGNLTEATAIFSEMNLRDTVAWNSIIKAHSHSGLAKTSFSLFREMIGEGLTPTSATFLAVLSACSHSGLVQKGLEIFDSMILDYGIVPEEKHYSCIVDLLGRSGRLKDARAFIKGLPMEPSTSIWRPLLAASRIHNNLPMAEFVAHRIQRKDPDDTTTYLTLSNMYAEVGNWSEAEKQRKLMEVRGLKKEPGCSWIEVNQRMHKFFSRDKTHAETERIYEKLEELVRQMEEVGYVRGTKIEFGHKQKDKEEKHVIHHSEKLAVSFGLISLPAGQSVRVFKNLRICRDCHEAMKMISTITNRTIVIRDNNRFHYFKGGGCSCDDYW